MPGAWLFIADNWAYGGAVSAGSVDEDHQAAWAVDGDTRRPIALVSGSDTVQVTNDTGLVDTVIVANHDVDEGLTITVSGDASGSAVVPAWGPNGIAPSVRIPVTPGGSPASVGSLSVAVSGNTNPLRFGELIAGNVQTVPGDGFTSDSIHIEVQDGSEGSNDPDDLPPYDPGKERFLISGSTYCNWAGRLEIERWFKGQRGHTRPSALILDMPDLQVDLSDVAFVGFLLKPTFTVIGPGQGSQGEDVDPTWRADLVFQETWRDRWFPS